MNDLTVPPAAAVPALSMSEDELLAVLESSLYPGAKPESIKLVIGWCKASGKDPLRRPAHIVPMNVKNNKTGEYEWRDVIMEGVGSLRTDAQRTGQFAGLSEAQYGPDKVLKVGDFELTYPEWCEIKAFRLLPNGKHAEFSSGRVRWLETYATQKRDSPMPNAMWKKRPYGQLEKCAEAMALRRGFPEIGSQPSADEMAGKTIGDDYIVVDEREPQKAISMPKPKVVHDQPRPDPHAGDRTEHDSAPPADPKPSQQANELATAGQKKFLENKYRAAGLDLAAKAAELGIKDFEHLTQDGWLALKEAMAS